MFFSYLLGNKGSHIYNGNTEGIFEGAACLGTELVTLIKERVDESVGCIKTIPPGSETWSSVGTGFRVGPTYLITAYHVLREFIENMVLSIVMQLRGNRQDREFLWEVKEALNVETIIEEHEPYSEALRRIIDLYLTKSATHTQFLMDHLSDIADLGMVPTELTRKWKRQLLVSFIKHGDFYIDWNIVFGDQNKDIVIVKLIEIQSGQEFPQQLLLDQQFRQNDGFHIIRYVIRNTPRVEVDQECHVYKDNDTLTRHIQNAVNWWASNYTNIPEHFFRENYDKCSTTCNVESGRVILRSDKLFRRGASGSPIVYLFNNEGQPVVGMIYQGGSPDFFYEEDQTWIRHDNTDIPREMFFERGTTMKKVAELLTFHRRTRLLRELFKQPETPPSQHRPQPNIHIHICISEVQPQGISSLLIYNELFRLLINAHDQHNVGPTIRPYDGAIRFIQLLYQYGLIVGIYPSSIIVRLQCHTETTRNEFWNIYRTYELRRLVQECLVSEILLQKCEAKEIKLSVEVTERIQQEVIEKSKDAIVSGNLVQLRAIVDTHFKMEESKTTDNILLIAAAKGSKEVCSFLLQQGFPSDIQMFDGEIAQILFGDQKFYKHSPLSIAVEFKQQHNLEILISEAKNSVIETIPHQELEMEKVILQETKKRLESKYEWVEAGFQEGRSALIVYTDSLETNQDESHTFCGRSFTLKNPNTLRSEPIAKSNHDYDISKEQLEIVRQIINENAPSLWDGHSNLSMISIGVVPEEDRRQDKPECFIRLICLSKGFIPVNQKQFPTELSTNDNKHSLPVKVFDGSCFKICPSYKTSFGRDFHQDLKIGCSIGSLDGTSRSGTIGPLIDINGQHGFLTCAHLFFDIPPTGEVHYVAQNVQKVVEVVHPEIGVMQSEIGVTQSEIGVTQSEVGVMQSEIEVMQPENGVMPSEIGSLPSPSKPCGKLFKAIFNTKTECSVDAAAVLISDKSRKPIEGRFAVGSVREYRALGFNEIPVFNSGHHKDPVNISGSRRVIKFGGTTGLTHGVLNCFGAQVRLRVGKSGDFVCKNQYEVLDIPRDRFFLPGDSGAAVFEVQDDHTLVCIGIAIGCTSYSTLVTPITAILNALGPEITLQTFHNPEDS